MSGRHTIPCTAPAMPIPLLWNRPHLRFIEGAGEGGTTDPATQGGTGGGFTAITTQEDFDKALGPRLARERDKFKDYAQFKTDSEELQRLKESTATDQEKALKAAKDEGRAEVLKVLTAERVRTALTTALQGRVPDPVALLDLDRTVFVKGDGADVDAIKQWVEHNSTAAAPNTTASNDATTTPDPSQGGTNAGGSQEAGRAAYERRHPKPQ